MIRLANHADAPHPEPESDSGTARYHVPYLERALTLM